VVHESSVFSWHAQIGPVPDIDDLKVTVLFKSIQRKAPVIAIYCLQSAHITTGGILPADPWLQTACQWGVTLYYV